MNNDIKIQIPKEVNFIINTLQENGHNGFVVGGAVRDFLLHKTPHDWDITTNTKPNDIVNIFEGLKFKVIPTGIKHGTVTVMIKGEGYEVTTYRIDGEYDDGRHPNEVTFTTSLKDDLSRRDFTINALAYNNTDGLIDYFGGVEDLEDGIIKCVGNAKNRMSEDNLRRLRAIRFACQLGFEIHIDTLFAVAESPYKIELLSAERIREEINKILLCSGENIIYGFYELWRTDILKYIMPELDDCYGFNQHNKHHDKTVFDHILSVVASTPPILELRLSALLHDIGKPRCFTQGEDGQGHFLQHHKISADMSRVILTRLKFDNKTINKVCLLIYEHMSRYEKLRTPNTKKFINRVGIENLDDLFTLQIADIKGCAKEYQNFDNVLKLKEECYKIINEKQPMSVRDLKLNGNDLMELGYKQGKEIGKILNGLLELTLEYPEYNEKETLIELVKNVDYQ